MEKGDRNSVNMRDQRALLTPSIVTDHFYLPDFVHSIHRNAPFPSIFHHSWIRFPNKRAFCGSTLS